MTAISKETAEKLYTILDENVGVFRQAEMPDGALKFHAEKKQEFIDTFIQEIPESYWFQGFVCRSAYLNFDSTGFHVMSASDEATHIQKVIDTVNEEIKASKIKVIG